MDENAPWRQGVNQRRLPFSFGAKEKTRWLARSISIWVLLHRQDKRVCAATSIKNGGSDRDRTGYLLVANEALSQMSYGPTRSIIILNPMSCSTQTNLYTPARVP